MNTKIAAVLGLGLIAAAIVLQLSQNSTPAHHESAAKTESPPALATPEFPVDSASVGEISKPSIASQNERALSSSTEEIIAKIKSALTHSGSRHTYATFSKLSETVDASNVRELLAFVQTLPKPQEKSMLVSLFVARWAELNPAAAIAYAEALPTGTARNWALTSAVSGWAEHDPGAATSWVQQLPAGPLRDQALQTVVSRKADHAC